MNEKRFATIGTFDGVHRGHQLLLLDLKEQACRRGMKPAAFVFTMHPLALIAPEKMPGNLMTFAEKADLIEDFGIEVIPLDFTENTRKLTSAQYMKLLKEQYDVSGLLIGWDNHFGSDRTSSLTDYRREGQAIGIEVLEAPVLPGINSTAIRRALRAGEVAGAAEMLGRPYRLSGKVVAGQQLGRKLGFPTANLLPADAHVVIPADGVYATNACFDSRQLPAVTNIGTRPTVDNSGLRTIETYIPGFSGDLYDKPFSIGFIEKIRDEKHFSGLPQLQAQMAEDTAEALKILEHK